MSFVQRYVSRLAKGFEAFETFTIDVIYNRRRGKWVAVYAAFLSALSILFKAIVKTRLLLYRYRILRNHHLGCLVIVVGNLTVGGTGKTPVVEKLAHSLRERGRTVAILSRGYKSKKEPFYRKWWRQLSHLEPPPPKIVSDGEKVLLDSLVAGDEPYMLARNLPGVIVLVDKDRVKAGLYAIRKFGVDTLILDDGFQYWALKDHLQLLMVDKNNPFGNGSLLPRGILREPVEHLRRASYIFLTKSDGTPDPELEQFINQHRNGRENDFIECTHSPRYLQVVNGNERRELGFLKDKRVAALSGIATPESFEKFLTDHGAEIVLSRRFIDHHRYSARELEELFRNASAGNLDMVVTTEKDAVRISSDFLPSVPFYYLRVEIEIISGVKDFEDAVSRICFPKKQMRATRNPFFRG